MSDDRNAAEVKDRLQHITPPIVTNPTTYGSPQMFHIVVQSRSFGDVCARWGFSFMNSMTLQSAVGGYDVGDFQADFGNDVAMPWNLVQTLALLGVADAAFTDGQSFGFSLLAGRLIGNPNSYSGWDGANTSSGPFPGGAADTWHIFGPQLGNGSSTLIKQTPISRDIRLLKGEHGEKQWFAKWTRADGTRSKWRPLDATIEHGPCCAVTNPKCVHRLQAEALAAKMAPKIRQASANGGKGETVEQYAKRWCEWREGRGLGCVDDDRAHLRLHVLPVIGSFDVQTASLDDLKRLVTALDDKARAGFSVEPDGGRRSFNWKTATNAWSVVRALFRDAQRAKDLSLCVRSDNPAEGVTGPDTGAKKAKTYLWPSEFAALVGSEHVPVRWARLFTVAVYAYAGAGELAALSWSDVDLEHGTIHVHRAVDRVRKREEKATKSETARRIPIEPMLVPLLTAMRREAGGTGRVLSMPSAGVLSGKLKHYLGRAGVDRADLFVTDDTRKAITFHDLRATGITWMAARGDDPLRIMQRAGHADFETTKIYMREAENLSAGFGSVFPSRPERLGIAPKSPRAIVTQKSVGTSATYRGADGNRSVL